MIRGALIAVLIVAYIYWVRTKRERMMSVDVYEDCECKEKFEAFDYRRVGNHSGPRGSRHRTDTRVTARDDRASALEVCQNERCPWER